MGNAGKCAMLWFIALALGVATSSEAGGLLSDDLFSIQKQVDKAIESLQLTPEALQQLSAAVRIDGRMIGGKPVDIKENEWQVGLIRAVAPDPQRFLFCGGSLVAVRWALTAAHCVDNFIVGKNPATLDVIVGTGFYPAGGERLKVENIIVHPKWNSQTNDYDFALLQLAQDATMGQPISFVADGLHYDGRAFVTGWGAIFEGGNTTSDLLGAEVPIVPTDICNRKESYDGRVTSSMICAGERDGGVDSCQGDSGGPLSAVIDGKRLLVGVVSWGEGCARTLKYGVYANVAVASSWIADSIAR